MNKIRLSSLAAATLGLLMATASAGPTEQYIAQRLSRQKVAEVPVENITKTPYAGLYEVHAENTIFYTDNQARYVFLGQIIDAATKDNITESRLQAVTRVSFADLPKELAVKIVKGDGSRRMAVFSDPECGHCRQLENNLKRVSNVTIYVFPLAFVSDKSETIAKSVLCAPDPARAWTGWMAEDITPPKAPASCTYNRKAYEALTDKLNISGTPTIIFADGTRVASAVSADNLELKLSATE